MLGCEAPVPSHLYAAAMRTDGRARIMMIENGSNGVGCDARRRVAEAHQPLAVLHGAREAFVRLDYIRSLNYRNLWHREIQLFDNDGHAPHWTIPAAFNEKMLSFFSYVNNCRQHAWTTEIAGRSC